MTIYFKSRGSTVLPVLRGCVPKISLKLMFYHRYLTKCVSGELSWSNSFILYVCNYNSIRQKPHDHLFQKSGQHGLASFARMCPKNLPKIDVLSSLFNQMRFWWAKLIKFIHFICMQLQQHQTEAPWPFISKVGAARSCQFCIYPKNLSKVMLCHWYVTERAFLLS